MDYSRRDLLKRTGTAVAGIAAASTAAGTAAAAYKGLPVYTNGDARARAGPGTGFDVKYTVEQYTGGYVVDGPRDADGYTWWKVRWNGDDDNDRFVGWTAEFLLDNADFAHPSTGYMTYGDVWDSPRYGGAYTHQGIDINNATGTPIYAARHGTVDYVEWNPDAGACGYYLRIDHGAGYETLYCHCSRIHVTAGETVNTGDHVADVGTSGNASDPHVHFEVNRYGDEVYVPGEVGDDVWALSGIQKDYAGIDSF
jgi:murein DD-endopeptidase MepM/ murein hydrolase activator NlpD